MKNTDWLSEDQGTLIVWQSLTLKQSLIYNADKCVYLKQLWFSHKSGVNKQLELCVAREIFERQKSKQQMSGEGKWWQPACSST